MFRCRYIVLVVCLVAVCGCELRINRGVDFSVCQQTPASSAIVECSDNGSQRLHMGWFDQPFL